MTMGTKTSSMSTCARDTPTIGPHIACLLMKFALNCAVLSHRDREHVRKEPRPARNFPLFLPPRSSVIHKNNLKTMVVVDLLQGS